MVGSASIPRDINDINVWIECDIKSCHKSEKGRNVYAKDFKTVRTAMGRDTILLFRGVQVMSVSVTSSVNIKERMIGKSVYLYIFFICLFLSYVDFTQLFHCTNETASLTTKCA